MYDWSRLVSCSVFNVRPHALQSSRVLTSIPDKIHQRLDFDGEEAPNEQYTVGVLREARRQVDAWQNEWDIVMSEF